MRRQEDSILDKTMKNYGLNDNIFLNALPKFH